MLSRRRLAQIQLRDAPQLDVTVLQCGSTLSTGTLFPAVTLRRCLCCRNIEAKELFCNEYRMVCTRLHALSLLVFLMIEIQQFLISMVVEMNAADVAAARLDARAIRWIF